MSNRTALKGLYSSLGPLRFISFFVLIAGVVLGYVLIEDWLAGQVGWPERYGFHCIGRACLIDGFWYSPRLLEHGQINEWLLFIWIWLYPGVLIVPVMMVLIIKRLSRRHKRIRPMK